MVYNEFSINLQQTTCNEIYSYQQERQFLKTEGLENNSYLKQKINNNNNG